MKLTLVLTPISLVRILVINLKVGYKYHYDYHHRDQQNHNFSQAVGGLITHHADGVTPDF